MEQILVADSDVYRPILTRFPRRKSVFPEMENRKEKKREWGGFDQ